jgi:serine/threonine-protein kinase RsbW
MGGQDSGSERFVLDFPSAPVWVGTARLFASSIARKLGCSEETIEEMKLAISESCGILIRASGDEGMLRLVLVPRNGRLGIEVRGGRSLPEHVPEVETPTPESFASAAAIDVLQSLFPDAEILGVPEGSSVSFDVLIEE